jgi:hypothetical protein
VNNLAVVDLQLDDFANFWTVLAGLFAYNEVPTIAVAKRLLVQGASSTDAPFFLAVPFNSIT